MIFAVALLLGTPPVVRAQDATGPDGGMNAVLWVRQSAEYEAATKRAYTQGTEQLDASLWHPFETASLRGRFERSPEGSPRSITSTVSFAV